MAPSLLLDSDRPNELSAEAQRRLHLAERYLTDSAGSSLALSNEQRKEVSRAILNRGQAVSIDEMSNRELLVGGFNSIDSTVRQSYALASDEISKAMKAVESTVVASHAETMQALNTLQNGIETVHNNVHILGDNLSSVSKELYRLSTSFEEYVMHDRRANSMQRAETKLIQLDQKLEGDFGQNKELRRTAVGILQAADLASVRTNTILTRAEELCISTPNYWLAPALVTLAQWVDGSRTGSNVSASEQVVYNTLKEAFIRDKEKTALFFGLLCLRANFIPEANAWFRTYVEMQQPKAVDRTCIMLLNIYAGGLMGHGQEEREILDVMQGWLQALRQEAEYEEALINDWNNTLIDFAVRAPRPTSYRALPAFCPEWRVLSSCLQATHIHTLLHAFLETELNRKDFKEDDTTLIDQMIAMLVTSFDGGELPIQREQEYQKLIVDLEGDEDVAHKLRVIKDDVLSETKNFLGIISDAARESELSSASIATRQYALRLQIPQISKSWLRFTNTYREATPKVLHLKLDNFTAQTADGSNEEAVIAEFVSQTNADEKDRLEKAKPGTKQMIFLVAGIALLVIGVIAIAVGELLGGLLVLLGGFLALRGWRAYSKAKKDYEEIRSEMKNKRESGVLIIRMFMNEVRTYLSEYAANESTIPGLIQYLTESAAERMDYIINPEDPFASEGTSNSELVNEFFAGGMQSSVGTAAASADGTYEVFEDEEGKEYVMENGQRVYVTSDQFVDVG